MRRHVVIMTLPFDTQQFLSVFAAYNASIWPAQIVAYFLGLVALAAIFMPSPFRERVILSVLAAMWAWNGLVYHLAFFAPINSAAFGFAALFVLQAMLFASYSLKLDDTRFVVRGGWQGVGALAFTVYAMVIYPVLGVIAGHGLMKGPLFGVAPCPTTIFTIGLLLLGHGRSVRWLAAVPLAWAVIGTSAAVLLGIPEDFGLGVAGFLLSVSLVVAAVAAKSNARPIHTVIDRS
ncbi:MAG: DUF6064 family protein [Aestuariivirga sp.]